MNLPILEFLFQCYFLYKRHTHFSTLSVYTVIFNPIIITWYTLYTTINCTPFYLPRIRFKYYYKNTPFIQYSFISEQICTLFICFQYSPFSSFRLIETLYEPTVLIDFFYHYSGFMLSIVLSVTLQFRIFLLLSLQSVRYFLTSDNSYYIPG